MDIICLGEVLIDMFPAELGRSLVDVTAFHPKPGGAPANVAVAAARLGAESAFIGKVGDDLFGHHLADVLAREGVETRAMRFDADARTTLAIVAKPDENTSEFVFYRNPGADQRLKPDELDAELLSETRAFHFGSLSLTDEPVRSATFAAAKVARKGGALVSFDVNYRPTLWESPERARDAVMEIVPNVNLLKVNETELALLVGDDLDAGTRTLLEMGPEIIVVTLGPDGSYFRVAGGSGHVPGLSADTVDATGAGDAFVAGLLTQLVADDWHENLAPDRMRAHLRYANAVGALTSLKQGAIPALPTATAVDEFLSQQSS